MIPILIPIAATIVTALWAATRPASQPISVEACTTELEAAWIEEDGVVGVYHEVSRRGCQQIVIECIEPPDAVVPTMYQGFPVCLRLTDAER